MKTYFKSWLAAAVSAAITFSALVSFNTSGADTVTEQQTYTLSFNLDYEGFTAKDVTLFDTVELPANSYITIPTGSFSFDTVYSTGWTYDGIYMFEAGDNFRMPEHDVVLEPVWADYVNSEFHNVSYYTEGEDYVVSNPTLFTNFKSRAGYPITPTSGLVLRNGYVQIGWSYNGNRITTTDKMIMPDNDVQFEPYWLKYYKVYYEAGDVDRISGNSSVIFDRYETSSFDIADSSRLSRTGFTLSGWLCDVDGQVYTPVSQFIMPSSDVHFTAVWTPKTYTVVFKSNNGKSETIKITGETDTAITAPACTFTNTGYKFAGWDYDGTIYQTGDEFIIPGAMPGLGISLNAVWVEDTGEEEIYDSISLVLERKQFVEGNASADDLVKCADFLLGR